MYFNVLKHTQYHPPYLPQPPALPAAPSAAALRRSLSGSPFLAALALRGGARPSGSQLPQRLSCNKLPPVFTKQLSASIQQQMFSVAFLLNPSRRFRGPGKPTRRLGGPTGSRGQVFVCVCRRLTRLTRVIIYQAGIQRWMDTLGGVGTPTGFLISNPKLGSEP